jgi:hypothetical protein
MQFRESNLVHFSLKSDLKVKIAILAARVLDPILDRKCPVTHSGLVGNGQFRPELHAFVRTVTGVAAGHFHEFQRKLSRHR